MSGELPDHLKDPQAVLDSIKKRIVCKHKSVRIWHDRSENGGNRCYTVCNQCDKIISELPRTDWFD